MKRAKRKKPLRAKKRRAVSKKRAKNINTKKKKPVVKRKLRNGHEKRKKHLKQKRTARKLRKALRQILIPPELQK